MIHEYSGKRCKITKHLKERSNDWIAFTIRCVEIDSEGNEIGEPELRTDTISLARAHQRLRLKKQKEIEGSGGTPSEVNAVGLKEETKEYVRNALLSVMEETKNRFERSIDIAQDWEED